MIAHNIYSAAVDIGQTTTKFALIDLQGKKKFFFDLLSQSFFFASNPFSLLSDQITELIKRAQSQGFPVSAIGISSTMDVNSSKGILRFINIKNFYQWKNFPIKQFFEKQFGLPVTVENDGIAAAWGEFCVGSGKGVKNFINIMIGTGIGGGIILDGKLLLDSVGSGSYFGHMSINLNGDECPLCHHKGCWELYASGSALEQLAFNAKKEKVQQNLPDSSLSSSKEIITAAHLGDKFAISLLNEIGYYLGFGLVNLANIFNPELIILGGGLIHAKEFITKPAIKVLNEKRMPLRKKIKVVESKLKSHAALVGVGLLAIDLYRGKGREVEIR